MGKLGQELGSGLKMQLSGEVCPACTRSFLGSSLWTGKKEKKKFQEVEVGGL
jgi:hypothetical protein